MKICAACAYLPAVAGCLLTKYQNYMYFYNNFLENSDHLPEHLNAVKILTESALLF